MILVREFGDWVAAPLSGPQVDAVRRAAVGLKERLGLRETPLVVRTTPAGVQVRARHVAGFVQVGELTIEIAPKFLQSGGSPRHGDSPRHDGTSWRDAFLAVLARLGRFSMMPRVAGARADTGLPDLMGLVIDDALARAATEGLPRHYEEQRAELTALRGQLDSERLWQRFVEPELLPCRFDVFTEDTPAARLMKWAAGELSDMVTSTALATRLRMHADALRHVVDEPPSDLTRDRIRVPPQYGYLDDAVEVARMLADGDALSMAAQQEAPARAFLWNTAAVFEDFVLEVCRVAMSRVGGSASPSTFTLASPVAGLERGSQWAIPTTPDVVLSRGGWRGLVDAKYKTLGRHPETSDVYQVMAGGRRIGTRTVALMYPATRDFRRPRTWDLHGGGRPDRLHALPLDLAAMAGPGGFDALVSRVEKWVADWRRPAGRPLGADVPAGKVRQSASMT